MGKKPTASQPFTELELVRDPFGTERDNTAGAQSIPNATVTLVEFDALSANFDSAAEADGIGSDWNGTVFTATKRGVYACHVSFIWQANATGVRTVQILRNSAFVGGFTVTPGVSVAWRNSTSSVLFMEVGDTLSFAASHTGGVTLTISSQLMGIWLIDSDPGEVVDNWVLPL